MRMLDLFSGIGGISLAAEWAGIETAAFCEIEPFCQKVLRKHWPHVPIYDDVRALTKARLDADGIGTIDIVVGGYPCQPFSVAGKRRGAEDDRHLWPEMFRIIAEIRPRWVVGENVAGHVNLGLDDVLSDLESIGYTAQAFVIPACAVGSPHRRDRVFIVAYTESEYSGRLPSRTGTENARLAFSGQDVADSQGKRRRTWRSEPEGQQRELCVTGSRTSCETLADAESQQTGGVFFQQFSTDLGANRDGSRETPTRPAQSGLDRVLDGLSNWLDGHRWPAGYGQEQYEWEPPRVAVGVKNRAARLKALGNAVVPQQIFPIFAAIRLIEESEETCTGAKPRYHNSTKSPSTTGNARCNTSSMR